MGELNEDEKPFKMNSNWNRISKVLWIVLLVVTIYARINKNTDMLSIIVVFAWIILMLTFFRYYKPVKRIAVNETKELEDVYQATYDSLDEMTKRAIAKTKMKARLGTISIIVSLILMVVVVIGMCMDHTQQFLFSNFLIIMICFILMMVFILIFYTSAEGTIKFKEEMIQPFIQKIIPGAQYDPTIRRDYAPLVEAYHKGFGSTPYHLISEDYIAARIQETSTFEMSDIYFKSYSSRNQAAPVFNFHGCFCCIDVHKQFASSKVLLAGVNPFDEKEIVRVDNERFNEYFEIHSNQHEEVKKYLTQELMEYLVNFIEQYGVSFDLAFEDKIYVRFYTDNMYELKLFGGNVDKQTVYEFYCITKFIKDIQEMMK